MERAPHIADASYGKCRVRLTHIDRSTRPHRVFIAAIDIALRGDFDASYTDGDNRSVVATDSMKNTVYVMARERGVGCAETFGRTLAEHFATFYDVVEHAQVRIEQEEWLPVAGESGASGAPYNDAFAHHGPAHATVIATWGPSGGELISGIQGLRVLKTAKSAFSDFHRDRYATLPDTDDRLFATTVEAEWNCDDALELSVEAHEERRSRVRALLLETFAEHDSLAVQQTLYDMGQAVLDAVPEISRIRIAMPNEHHLLVNLQPFGLDNDNRVFVGTREPHGQIEATLTRDP